MLPLKAKGPDEFAEAQCRSGIPDPVKIIIDVRRPDFKCHLTLLSY